MRRKQLKIYQSRWHLAFTLSVVIIPFLFLLVYARLSHITTAELLGDVSVSLLRLSLAYVFGAVIAWVLAVSFHRGRRAAVAIPLFDVLNSFPISALLPFAAFFLGPTSFTVILFLIVIIAAPMIFSIISSLRLVKRDWEEVVKVYNLRGFAYFKLFLLPVSLPGLVTGSIIGVGNGWQALVVTEIIISVKTGLGPFFNSFANNPLITALGVFGLLLIIFAINKLVWLQLLELSHKRMEE